MKSLTIMAGLITGLSVLLGCSHAPVQNETYEARIIHVSIDEVDQFEHSAFVLGKDLSALVERFDQPLMTEFCGTSASHEPWSPVHTVDGTERSTDAPSPRFNATITGYHEERRLIDGKLMNVIHLQLREAIQKVDTSER